MGENLFFWIDTDRISTRSTMKLQVVLLMTLLGLVSSRSIKETRELENILTEVLEMAKFSEIEKGLAEADVQKDWLEKQLVTLDNMEAGGADVDRVNKWRNIVNEKLEAFD